MNMSGLSFNALPPIDLPFRFFLSAPLFIIACALLVLFSGETLWLSRWQPNMLALTHGFTLGFLTMVMMGALLQLLPVIGGIGIVIGLVTYGHRVIATVGTGITQLTPSRGFAATLAAATTVVVASGTGLPISTTHTLVGAILGVGLAVGRESLNYRQIGAIFMSWLVTLPAGAALSIFFFFIFKAIWG